MAAKQSLRDGIDSMESKRNLRYHIELRSLSRNNLSYALQNRPHQIFEKTFYTLLGRFHNERGWVHDKRFKFTMPLRTIDSTTISLCLSLFDWAHFRKKKGGIKLHVLLNNRDQLPEFVNYSNAEKHDITAADSFPIVSNSIYVFDKGYICFDFLAKINTKTSFSILTTFRIVSENLLFNKELPELLNKKPPPLIDTGRGDGVQLVLSF